MNPVICVLTEEKERLERRILASSHILPDTMIKLEKDLELISRVLAFAESIEKEIYRL